MTKWGNDPSRNNWFFADGATDNQAWDNAIAIADVGRITDINAYFGGDTAGCTGGPTLHNSSGTLLQYSSHSVSRGSRSANGGFTVTTSGLDITFNNPTTYILGGFRNSGDSWVVPFNDGSAYGVLKTVGGSSPGAASGGSSWISQTGFTGGITAYGNYFAITLNLKRSGSMSNKFWQLRRAGVWTTPKVWLRSAGAWKQVGIVAKDQELDWKKEIPCIVEWAKGVWEHATLRWEYDRPKKFGRLSSGLLVAGEYA